MSTICLLSIFSGMGEQSAGGCAHKGKIAPDRSRAMAMALMLPFMKTPSAVVEQSLAPEINSKSFWGKSECKSNSVPVKEESLRMEHWLPRCVAKRGETCYNSGEAYVFVTICGTDGAAD
jgi:hypothetical protein